MENYELDYLIGENRGLIRAYKLATQRLRHYSAGPTWNALKALADQLCAQSDAVGLAIDAELRRRKEAHTAAAAVGVGSGPSLMGEASSCPTPTVDSHIGKEATRAL